MIGSGLWALGSGRRVLRYGLTLVFVIAADPVSAQQATGSLTGYVSDTAAAPLPGVHVYAATPGGSSGAVTAADGSYTFSNLREGRYTVYACLPGFTTVAREVTVSSHGAVLDVQLRVAPICECLAPPDLPTLFKQADLVLRVKLTRRELALGYDSAPMVVHTAHILKQWKRDPRVAGDTVVFQQDLEGDCEPYQIGRDLVLFLKWDPRKDAFVRIVGAFTIDGGRLISPLSAYDGKPVDVFGSELDRLAAK
jgi:hypothetical protein